MSDQLYCLWSGVRSKKEILAMLAKVTYIADVERQKGGIEHASLMAAVGVGLRWAVRDWDFGFEEISKPQKKVKYEGKL